MEEKRSNYPFPSLDDVTSGYIRSIWEKGWLDEYSDEHFLIRAIHHKLNSINWSAQLVNNNLNGFYTPIDEKGEIDYDSFTTNFIMNLSNRLFSLDKCFGEEAMRQFVTGQLSAGKRNYDEDQFFQAMSEIEILSFFATRCSWTSTIYEPPLGENNSNPEASFEFVDNGYRVKFNVEVKTPKFLNPTETTEHLVLPCVLLSNDGRKKIKELCEANRVNYKDPRVTKLVDFINSAAKKFKVPEKNEFNLLYINWSYSDFPSYGFLEAWTLLSNELNGIITNPSIGKNLNFREPICDDAYKKITAIIVYTSSLDQLMFSDFLHCWISTSPKGRHHFRMLLLDKNVDKGLLRDYTVMNPDEPIPHEFRILANVNSSNAEQQKLLLDILKIVEKEYLKEDLQ